MGPTVRVGLEMNGTRQRTTPRECVPRAGGEAISLVTRIARRKVIRTGWPVRARRDP